MPIRKLARMILLLALPASLPASAADRLLRLETRTDVSVPVFYLKRENASATVILLPGGNGGFGTLIDGQPSSKNFLVRTRDSFAAAGLNVAVMSRPSDKSDLDYPDRVGADHLQDIRTLVNTLKADSGLPVWLVGTSRGTVSATAAAVAFGNSELAGVVLTSSVVSRKKIGAVPMQDLGAIRIPVLIVHHEQDDCSICRPDEVPAVLQGLVNAPVKKLMMLSGGDNPTGKSCGALHHHGFIGIENKVVALISQWIKQASN